MAASSPDRPLGGHPIEPTDKSRTAARVDNALGLRAPPAWALAWRILVVLAMAFRHLLTTGLRYAVHRPPASADVARRLRRTVADLGGLYVKFGQLIGSAPGVFGDELANEFRAFLDQGPPLSASTVRRILQREWGRDPASILRELDDRPVACASLAVVHRAILYNGDVVAIKVLRPGIEAQVAVDLGLLRPLAALLARRFGVGEVEPAVRLLDGLSIQLHKELDLRGEAQVMHAARAQLAQTTAQSMTIPLVYDDLSTRRVLVTDFVAGVPIDDSTTLSHWGVSASALVEELIHWWFKCALSGTFHADLHAGNLLVTPDGRLAVVDWGIVGSLDRFGLSFFHQLLAAVLGDDNAWAAVLGPLVSIWDKPPGVTDREVASMLRDVVTAVLTQPFGTVDLSPLIVVPERPAKRSVPGARSHGEQWKSGAGTDFERMLTLLFKQLLYFERYGRLYMPDKSVLQDREFFARLLANQSAGWRPVREGP